MPPWRYQGYDPPESFLSALTPKENQVAQRIARGWANREIGLDLSISVKTVKTHLGNIYVKFGRSSRMALAYYLWSRGIGV